MFTFTLLSLLLLPYCLVSISGRVVLRRDNQTPALLCTLVDCLDDVDELLFVFEDPVEFVVVAGAKITHHVFVAEEEHKGNGVVEFVHLLEVGDLIEVADVDNSKVLDALGDFVEHFILAHAVGIPVAAEANYHQSFVFGEDSLIDVPGGDEMGDDDGTHGCSESSNRIV